MFNKKNLIIFSVIFTLVGSVIVHQEQKEMSADRIYSESIDSIVEIIVEVPASPEIAGSKSTSGVGTGFFISSTEILTNEHVIHGKDKVKIKFHFSDELFDANVITTDKNADFAVITPADIGLYEKFKLKSLVLNAARNNKNGQRVVAIGNPYGMEFSVSEGIISNTDRDIEDHHGYFIQTDASVLPGNSGGPLFNTQGQVIGMNEFTMGNNTIGFSIPSEYMLKFLRDFKNEVPIQYAYMGAKMKTISSKVFIESVIDNLPAEKAGLKSGDQLNSITTKYIQNKEIKKFADLVDELTLINKGDIFELSVTRDKEIIYITVTPEWKNWEPLDMVK